ncbi:MAG: methyltransferase, CheR-type with sensor [Gemmatimonadetes bacterium]|nr:methyltransferase, CheR-type with sensor [Gemmatimonadota bacterium]
MSQSEADLDTLVEHLKRNRGFDFTGYKRASLERRVAKRMQGLNMATFAEYLDHLEVHPEEFVILFNTILINVTAFFRDPSTWDVVAGTIIPELLARHQPGLPIRVWSAGCASGEEAYTLAMLFAEAMGAEPFREHVKIYATDVDEEALGKARQAAYTEREIEGVPPELLEKYFERVDGRFVFQKDIRRQVIFGRHDLIQDAPISRVDLLTCRNTLMYFNAETQARILSRLQFALNDNGVLVLGRAETLMTHANAFTPLDVKRRISRRLPTNAPSRRERLIQLAQAPVDDTRPKDIGLPLRTAALDAVPTAQILVDAAGTLALANERARSLFGLGATDIGSPIQDLKISYRPVELRGAIETVMADGKPVVFRDVEWSFAGDPRWFEVHVSPLIDVTGVPLGASVAFHDVTVAKRLHGQLEHSNQELETAYEELQSTNEELETTNEELQSTVEELETTNEELQSTNEELETMNEELQSTNEELQTMNDEIRLRSDDLNHANAFLESILESLSGAVVVIDTELMVLVWNDGASELWGLREGEVRGKNILGLDIGLQIEQLKAPIRACLNGTHAQAIVPLDAVNRRGRAVRCIVTVTPLKTRSQSILGAILLMEAEQSVASDGDGNGNGDGSRFSHQAAPPATKKR